MKKNKIHYSLTSIKICTDVLSSPLKDDTIRLSGIDLLLFFLVLSSNQNNRHLRMHFTSTLGRFSGHTPFVRNCVAIIALRVFHGIVCSECEIYTYIYIHVYVCLCGLKCLSRFSFTKKCEGEESDR